MLLLFVIGQLVLGYISWKTGPVVISTAHVALGRSDFCELCHDLTLQSFREGALGMKQRLNGLSGADSNRASPRWWC